MLDTRAQEPIMKFAELPRGRPGTRAAEGDAPRALWMDQERIGRSDFWSWSPEKIFLGATEGGQLIGIGDDRHLAAVAGSRGGKGQSSILPNLAFYAGSVVVIDPKGENATLSAERRGEGRGVPAGGLGQEVYVLDPFRVSDVPDAYRASYNPLADLDPDSQAFVDDCDSIADALVVAAPGQETNHWNSSARMVLRGFIAWVAASPTVELPRTLGTVRRMLHLPPDATETAPGFNTILAEMLDHPEIAHGVPAEMAGAILGMGPDEAGSVMSTVRQNVVFLSSPAMAAMLEGEGRVPDLAAWKMGGVSVYLCLPATRMHRHARFFRLFINRLLAAVESRSDVPKVPALMLLDEMHVLGHMAALETAAGLIAGYGVRIWSIWQDFSQLKSLYRDRWETFLGNASVLQSFGLNDLTTLKYVSDRLGTSSILSISKSEQSMDAKARGFAAESRSIQASPLLSPEEVAEFFSRQSGNQLVLYPGASPIFLKRVPFYDPWFDRVRVTKSAGKEGEAA